MHSAALSSDELRRGDCGGGWVGRNKSQAKQTKLLQCFIFLINKEGVGGGGRADMIFISPTLGPLSFPVSSVVLHDKMGSGLQIFITASQRRGGTRAFKASILIACPSKMETRYGLVWVCGGFSFSL